MEDGLMVVIALGLLIFGAVSGRAERSPVTPPMVFVVLGLGLGPWGVGWIELPVESPLLDRLGEFALILVLFTDASRIDLRSLRREASLPARLLGIGLPLSIAAGAGLALICFPGFGVWEALLLAAILAPTDAALGQAVVSSPLVPQRIRQTLNVESGLNDGLALPVVLLALSLAEMMGEGGDVAYWVGFALRQVGLGPMVGIAVGYLGGQLVSKATDAAWMSKPFQNVSALALAVLAFSAAETIGGNGFIAAFVCGLTLGNTAQGICDCLHEFGEAEGQLLTLMVFLLFGAVIVPGVVLEPSPATWVYALGSLTLVRLLPVAISLLGTGLMPASLGFLGWFGPRGLASILYMLIVVEHEHLAEGPEIDAAVALTVLLSVFAHGFSAHPLAARYGRWFAAAEAREMPEARAAMELPVRLRFASETDPAARLPDEGNAP